MLGLVRFGYVWLGRLGLVRFGQVWLGLVRLVVTLDFLALIHSSPNFLPNLIKPKLTKADQS